MDDKKALLEAALFLSIEPLDTKEIARILSLGSLGYVKMVVEELRKDLEEEKRGLELVERDGKYELTVKRKYLGKVSHLAPYQDLSGGVLKTLAVIAYHHPIEQNKVIEVRGNRAYAHIKELRDRRLIKSEKTGRTNILRVTKDFLRYFGLETPEEFRMYFSGSGSSDRDGEAAEVGGDNSSEKETPNLEKIRETGEDEANKSKELEGEERVGEEEGKEGEEEEINETEKTEELNN